VTETRARVTDEPKFDPSRFQAIVIGASAGAIEALSQILPALPQDFPLPVVIVVHLPPDHTSTLPELFAGKCRVKVKEAEDKENLNPGTVCFAPPNYHVLLENNGSLSLSSDEPSLFSRPSIDVLFESAADAFGGSLLALVLSGANNDGAHGAAAICQAGGLVLAQDPATAMSPVMPKAALEACPGARLMPLDKIRDLLLQCRPARRP
jgi:two-component system chemotaxis response regulator CheB